MIAYVMPITIQPMALLGQLGRHANLALQVPLLMVRLAKHNASAM
jgi:hypothetical protein